MWMSQHIQHIPLLLSDKATENLAADFHSYIIMNQKKKKPLSW